ncbi:dual specificity protein phosphatase PHS1 isoform X2 [Nymphaea colorata]|nr:dual specificity protein phosphatase PHS1 isoform X2 [Nymphaea colorata]
MAFSKWLALVRRRSMSSRSSGFPNRSPKVRPMPLQFPDTSDRDFERPQDLDSDSGISSSYEESQEISLWDRLGKAAVLDIESGEFSWDMLSSLHHTEHSGSAEQSEDEMTKNVEVTVNSGGVVFFALFGRPDKDDLTPKEAAAVIKFSSSRMATQSERLGYEFAKWLGIRTPQARVIHNSSFEWQQIKDGAEKAKTKATADGDEIGEMTCSELLEALELSRCLLLMNYVHGTPLLDSTSAFESQSVAEKTAAALGRILMLDLVLRNEDRLPCRLLGWRGNSSNLLFAEEVACTGSEIFQEDLGYIPRRNRASKTFQKERRFSSVDGRISPCKSALVSQSSDLSELVTTSLDSADIIREQEIVDTKYDDFQVIAIDTGVPRRPPAGKRANDQAQYPKMVELLLNSFEFSGNLLYEISRGELGFLVSEEGTSLQDPSFADSAPVVHEFRSGFRASLRELQGFHIFLLTVYQRLDCLLRSFLTIINRSSLGDSERDDFPNSDSWQPSTCSFHSPFGKERDATETNVDTVECELQKTTPKSSSSGSYSTSPISRDNWHGRYYRGGLEAPRSLRLTMKLRDFNKFAKVEVEAELSRDLERWNEMLKADVVKYCQDNNFNSGFFEGSDNHIVVDAYELKVRLEHILERIVLITDAANTERPSLITGNLFIGGALAARSVHTLQYLGITHILCLCSNEVGQADSQFHELFEYNNFSICDTDDAEINSLFEVCSDFIEHAEQSGGKVLVHCFEGKSRSVTVVLAYLMLRKHLTLLQAWNELKRVHHRSQPNDGFKRILLELDKKLHGSPSMEWQQRKPMMKLCPICGKNAGLSTSSLKLHLQKSHKSISSGSVDSAMTMEFQKIIGAVKIG